jgi:hypothetical protein
MDNYSHRFAADISQAFHLLPAVEVDAGGILYRQNDRLPFHAPYCPFPVRIDDFFPVKLFVTQQIIYGRGL